jgi:glycosyltransferase involved in cell wall biosynthesis
MKILQVNNVFRNKGGAEKVYFSTIDLLKRNGHQVIPFSIGSSNNEASEYSYNFINDRNWLHNNFFSIEAQKKIEKIISVEKPEIAHLHNIIGGVTYSIIPILKKYSIPIVSTVHDFRILCPAFVFVNSKNEICEKCKNGQYYHCALNNCSRQSITKSVMLSAESYLRDYFIPYYKKINSFIAVSNFVKNKLLEVHPELSKKVTVNYNFSTVFSSEIKKGDYFIYFGRLAREKGLPTLLEAFRQLKDLKLILVGDGELRKQIELEKPPNVEILGFKTGNELKSLIQNSYFVIASSECNETSSMMTIESNSLAKPVIGADIGGISELIENGITGFIYESRNSGSLMKLLMDSMQLNSDKYKNMCNNAYKFALDNFSPELHYKSLVNIYQNTLQVFH